MKKSAAVALAAMLAAGVTACSPGAPPSPRLGGGLSAACKLFWTYQSAHGIPQYQSFAAAYKADLAEYRQQPGSLYQIMPVLQPQVRITARSTVNIGSIEVDFYDQSGAKTNHSTQVAVNEVLTGGHSYSAVAWSGLSDPPTGDTNVASCAVAAWTRREHAPSHHQLSRPESHAPADTTAIEAAASQVTKGPGSRAAGLAMAFKLIEAAQDRWRAVNAPHLVALVCAGARFERGVLAEREAAA